ncbi:MAG: hypothetical protein K0U66_06870, partial [Gammaproteobacteria bacterium]|nr:hypothetical protein [Gammaproteobacteria bacterium]
MACGVFAIALFLRLYLLNEIPPGLFIDEGANGLDALAVLRGDHALFFARNRGREGLFIYTIVPFVAWLGRIPLALRLPAALANIGTVLALFWLGNLLFGQYRQSTMPWRGLLIGGVAAGLMAVSLNQTILGRIAFRVNLLLPLLTVAIAALWLGFQQRRLTYLILAGICTGLLPYTYIPARFFPILLLLWAVVHVLVERPSMPKLRRCLFPVLLYLTISTLVATPLLVHFIRNPADFISRSDSLFVFNAVVNSGDPLSTLIRNMLDHLAALGFRGDPNWRHNYDGRPLLNPAEVFFFWFGLAVALAHWRSGAYRLLVIWFAVMLLPAVLAVDNAPNTLRMMGMTPAIYLLIGVGIWHSAFGVRQLMI